MLLNEKDKAFRRANTFYRVSSTLAESASIEEIARVVLDSINEHFDWDQSVFHLVRPGASPLFPEICRPPDAVIEPHSPARDECLHLRTLVTRSSNAAPGFASGIWLPVRAGQSVYGIIECLSARKREDFEEMRTVLGTIGWQLTQYLNQKAADYAFHESGRRLSSILESMSDGFYTLDRDGRFTYANSECEHVFKRTRAELMGLKPRDAFVQPMEASSDSTLQPVFQKPMGRQDFEYFSEKLERWLEFHIHPTEFGHSVFFKDITERKESERLVVDQQLRIVAASKMSTLGEMAGGIAHEINNPLAIIHGRAEQLREMIETGNSSPESMIAIVSKIEQTVMRISKIIRGLRSFARDAHADPYLQADVTKLTDETLSFCRERFQNHSVEVTVEHVSGDLALECQDVQISQLLLNLLNNAYDAVQGKPEKWIQIQTKRSDDGQNLILSITDSGDGIPEAVREKMFNPFFTTKSVGQGTGLGLSITRGIIESHQGSIRLEEKCPHTRFVIELPLRNRPAA